MLSHLPKRTDPKLLVGTETVDDAGVYQIADNLAIVQTADLFPPVVDEPYWFGAIAAANALSDVYAMGGRPLTALNLIGWPTDIPYEVMAEVLTGGSDKLAEAGATLVGGHSWEDAEPKFGMSVTGLIDPNSIVTNAAARPGDVLVLTKPLGMGIITTGIKNGMAEPEAVSQAIAIMACLNRDAAEAMLAVGVHAATDVTGFGLLGHLSEMTVASRVGAELDFASIPILPEAHRLAEQDVAPGGSRRNLEFLRGSVSFDGLTPIEELLLADAQTSGGLLIAVEPGKSEDLLARLRAKKTPAAAEIGRLVPDASGRIRIGK